MLCVLSNRVTAQDGELHHPRCGKSLNENSHGKKKNDREPSDQLAPGSEQIVTSPFA